MQDEKENLVACKQEDVKEMSGCGAAGAHLLWEQGVRGSNPLTPTMFFNRKEIVKMYYLLGRHLWQILE